MMKKEEHTRPFDNHCRTPSAQEYKSKQKRIKEKGEEQRKERVIASKQREKKKIIT